MCTEDMTMKPLQLATSKSWPREGASEVAWRATATGQEAQEKLAAAVDAFVSGDYEGAIKVVDRERVDQDELSWSNVRWVRPQVTIPAGELEDPQLAEFHRRQLLKEGEARHAVMIEQNPAERTHEYRVTVPQVLVQLEDGSSLDLFEPVGSQQQVREVEALRSSPAGRKLAATQAVIAMEERLIHVPQAQNLDRPISPSYAQFAIDEGEPRRGDELFEAYIGINRSFKTKEQEVVTMLHDAGMPIAMLEEHVAPNHEAARAPVMRWLKAQSQL